MPVTEQTRPQTRAPAETREPQKPTPVRRASSHARRLFLAVLMAVVSVNVWTGAPLLSLWIGSKVQGSGPPSMGAIAATAGALVVLVIVLVAVMNRLSAAYDREAGTINVRQHVPWLRSML